MHGRAFFRFFALAPRAWLAFGLAGSACAIALYTWASRGETLASTLAAQTGPPRSIRKAAARPMYLFGLRPLHLCGTRLEGGHQGLSRRYGQLEGEPLAWCRRRRRPLPEHPAMRKRWLARGGGYLVAEHLRRVSVCAGGCVLPCCRVAVPPCRRVAVPPCRRRCRRALWLDPREPQGPGESSVPTLEASSAQVERP